MDYVEKIREMARQSGGVITSKEIKSSDIPTIYLTRMVENGQLSRVGRGIYMDSDGVFDEYFFFHNRFQVAVFSYVSALYLQGCTDMIPNEMEITVYKGYNPHSMDQGVRIHYVKKEIYELGITECTTMFGNKVKAYDLERTVCDFIKNRDEIEAELFSKTVNNYVRSKNRNLNKLYEYSKKMKIYNKVKELMEVLMI